jgi:hypothetical protein
MIGYNLLSSKVVYFTYIYLNILTTVKLKNAYLYTNHHLILQIIHDQLQCIFLVNNDLFPFIFQLFSCYLVYIITYMSDSSWAFGLEIGFMDHFNTRLFTTINYNTITDYNILHITITHAKCFHSVAVSLSRSLVTASSSGDSSTAPTKSSLHKLPYNLLQTHY